MSNFLKLYFMEWRNIFMHKRNKGVHRTSHEVNLTMSVIHDELDIANLDLTSSCLMCPTALDFSLDVLVQRLIELAKATNLD